MNNVSKKITVYKSLSALLFHYRFPEEELLCKIICTISKLLKQINTLLLQELYLLSSLASGKREWNCHIFTNMSILYLNLLIWYSKALLLFIFQLQMEDKHVLCLVAQSDSLHPMTVSTRLLCPWNSQARILEWVSMPSFRGSSQPRGRTQVSHIAGRFFAVWATREAHEYWNR